MRVFRGNAKVRFQLMSRCSGKYMNSPLYKVVVYRINYLQMYKEPIHLESLLSTFVISIVNMLISYDISSI